MAVAFVRAHGNHSLKAAGTTDTYTTAAIVPAGNLLVAVALADNATTQGKPDITGISTPAGETNTWARVMKGVPFAAVAAGAMSIGEMWCIRTTVAWPSATVLTFTWDTSITMKAEALFEFSGALDLVYNKDGGYDTTTTPAVANTADAGAGSVPTANDLAVGFLFGSNVAAAQAGSNSTVGGTWSGVSGVGSTGGNVATNNFGVVQYKVLNATGHLTYNNSAAMSAYNCAVIGIFQAAPEPTITQASYRIYDDGTETGAVALAAQDTPANGDVIFGDGIGQLRVRLQSTNAGSIPATDDWQLQYEKNASGSWNNVGPSGTEVLTDTYASTNVDAGYGLTTVGWLNGQSVMGTGLPLSRVGFWVYAKNGTPTQSYVAYVYAHTGTFGTDGIGTGSPLATSNSVSASSMVAGSWVYFTFSTPIVLASGTPYVVVMGTNTSDSSNYIQQGYDTSSPTNAGNRVLYNGSSWFSSPTIDVAYQLYSPASVVAYASPNTTDAAVTTNRLGAGTGSFSPGEISETGLVTDFGFAPNGYTELLFPLAIQKANVVAGDVIRFRVLRNGSTTGMTYTAVPTVNVVESTITQASYRIYDDGAENGSTALAAQDTAPTVDVTAGDAKAQVRVRLQSTSAAPVPATDDFGLQWEKNGSGTWTDAFFALPTPIDTYDASNAAGGAFLLGRDYAAIGQSFTGTGVALGRVDFYLSRTGSTPFNVTAKLYTHTGTFGSTGLPGTVLATSSTYSSTSIGGGAGWYSFDFDGTFTLVNGTRYFVVLEASGGDTANYIQVYNDTTSSTHAGNPATFTTSWATQTSDIIFRVFPVLPVLSTVEGFPSANLSDGTSTTNRLGAGTGTFVAGKVSEDGLADDVGISVGNYTELLYSVTLKQADLANGDTLRFRVLRNGATTGLTYTQYPSITISAGAAGTDWPATIADNWGTWTANATGTVTTPAPNWPATVTTVWDTWVSTAAAGVEHPAAIPTVWTTWTGTAVGTVSGPAPSWGIPQNVVATSTGQTTITVTWDAVPAASGYDVERNGVVIATDWPASPYLDTGLVASTPYNYRVRAVDALNLGRSLLNGASARFDYSQYSDVANMRDVNNNWGPLLATAYAGITRTFTTAGLRHTGSTASYVYEHQINAISGPVVCGPNGLSSIHVIRYDSVRGTGQPDACNMEFYSPDNGFFVKSRWYLRSTTVAFELVTQYLDDQGVGRSIINLVNNNVPPNNAATDLGVFITLAVHDVRNMVSYLWIVSPTGSTKFVTPMTPPTPNFVSIPQTLNSIWVRNGANLNPVDLTVIETAAWNRALTDTEMNALVSFFQAGG